MSPPVGSHGSYAETDEVGNVENKDPSLIELIGPWCRLTRTGTNCLGDSQLFVTEALVTSPQTERPLACAMGFSRISPASLTT